MLADPLGPLSCRLRGRRLHTCGVRVDLVGVRSHGCCGIAAVELSEESPGIALIDHTDEGLLLAYLEPDFAALTPLRTFKVRPTRATSCALTTAEPARSEDDVFESCIQRLIDVAGPGTSPATLRTENTAPSE